MGRIIMFIVLLVALTPMKGSAAGMSQTKADLLQDTVYKIVLCTYEDDVHKDRIYPCAYVMHNGDLYLTIIDKDGEFAQFIEHNEKFVLFWFKRDQWGLLTRTQ